MEVDKVEDELTIRKREAEKVQELVKQTVGEGEMQPGTNWSGLYELSGESMFRDTWFCDADLRNEFSHRYPQGSFCRFG